MRVPLEWLYEYCRPDLKVAQLADRLTLTGTKVESIEHHGVDALDRFVVVRVVEAERHPDADGRSVGVVDIGGGERSQIVGGALNVAAGQTVAGARPGAVMPDGTKLKAARLRGVESLQADAVDHGAARGHGERVVDRHVARLIGQLGGERRRGRLGAGAEREQHGDTN